MSLPLTQEAVTEQFGLILNSYKDNNVCGLICILQTEAFIFHRGRGLKRQIDTLKTGRFTWERRQRGRKKLDSVTGR